MRRVVCSQPFFTPLSFTPLRLHAEMVFRRYIQKSIGLNTAAAAATRHYYAITIIISPPRHILHFDYRHAVDTPCAFTALIFALSSLFFASHARRGARAPRGVPRSKVYSHVTSGTYFQHSHIPVCCV